MVLSPKYKFLYVHIAKTGGTSVRAALQKYRRRDPYRLPMWIGSRLSHLTGHKIGTKLPRHAGIICAQEMIPQELFDELFKFAIVRNPWDLQVSSWHHLKRTKPDLVENCDSFESFIHYKFDPERPYQFDLDTSIKLQLDYLVDLHRNLLTDYVGRYETLQESFDHICETIGIPTQELPRKNAAKKRRDYREYYSDELAELVGERFSPDIETFGYTFDPA